MVDDTTPNPESENEEVDAQCIPPEVVAASTPVIIMALTAIFKTVISFITWRWLEKLFPEKKETDERPTE